MDSAASDAIFHCMQLTVTVCHDKSDGVWFVQSFDVPGLNAEATTLDELIEAIEDLARDLVAANLPQTYC